MSWLACVDLSGRRPNSEPFVPSTPSDAKPFRTTLQPISLFAKRGPVGSRSCQSFAKRQPELSVGGESANFRFEKVAALKID
jgi:hypothetical protein